MALDRKGRVYGTTYGGGDDYGTVYRLTHQPDGRWTEKVLYRFQKADPNGQYPIGTVTLDSLGNVYGTTSQGGTENAGTVFQMSASPSGWTLNLLYRFCSQSDCTDGEVPWAGVVFDRAGNLYGTAGNAFELTPGPGGWTESVLYNFCAQPGCSDGNAPYEGVILDSKGNLFGATYGGGSYKLGTVYKLRPMPDGTWQERVLHSFGGPNDGSTPGSAMLVAMDDAGNLYGTTSDGGANLCGEKRCGIVFRLTHQPNGHWKETILHQFKSKGGANPNGGVVIDGAGNLYGSTVTGGDPNCQCGVVYKLAPNGDGTWTYTVLHRFIGSDGYEPDSNLTLDDQGNLFGTTLYGGPGGGGVVFEFTP